jgi:hypothetical protein
MAIPPAQLETWAHQGATVASQLTHNSIRNALETADTSVVKEHTIEIFSQGSYRNSTNIYADSDVDVVALLTDTYTRDTSRLVAWQREAELRAVTPTTYSWQNFRQDVLLSLRRYYGDAVVHGGNKAIRLDAGGGRLAADVVPAIEHRVYTSYGNALLTPTTKIEGISFWDQTGRHIVNFPKEHIKNGQGKNAILRTGGSYKPIVRMFKNARQHLIERRLLGHGLAPSYFVECLLYNVPDRLFLADRQAAMSAILSWLWNADKNQFWCQNGQVPLIGATAEQWTMPNADAFLVMMVYMWHNWPI